VSSYYEGKGKTVEEAATDAGKKAKRALKKSSVQLRVVEVKFTYRNPITEYRVVVTSP